MKRVSFLIAIMVLCIFAIAGCKKNGSSSSGCPGSGIISPNYYLFWFKTDVACGWVTVTVKNAQGQTVATNYPTTKMYEPVAPQCNQASYDMHATYQLIQGNTYTYEATCTGKRWSGTITVPCEQSQCKTILIQ
jgi:hypothetical protein